MKITNDIQNTFLQNVVGGGKICPHATKPALVQAMVPWPIIQEQHCEENTKHEQTEV